MNMRDHPVSGRRLFWTIVLNSIITVAEFVAGLISGYLALTADAVHNLSDVAALVLAWLGVKGSQLPATKRSTYGFMRIEVMTAFISAVSLVVIALFIIWEAYQRLMNPVEISMPWLFLTVTAIGLLGNLLSVVLLHREKDKSLNLKTAFLHMAYDTASSGVVLIGGVVILFTGLTVIDPILSTAIALMIFWSSYLVIKEAVMILMEAVPSAVNFDQVHRAIRAVPAVCDVHDLHIWSLSSYEIALSCHVCLKDEDYSRGPAIVTEIGRLMRERFGIGHSTIQIEQKGCDRSELLCRHHGHDLE
ncbi:MAG: cation diffusion facilitator family transporter [Candidatus Zixiibacteriota bacterium]